jgi:serine/threonine-protein kinase HipA
VTGPRARRGTTSGGGRAAAGKPSDVEVWVDIAGTPTLAGRLYSHRHGKSESATFTYEAAYLANGDAYQLDPGLPMVSGMLQTPTNQKIFGAFADSCPDRWGRRLIQRTEKHSAGAAERTPVSFGEFDLLVRVRDDLRQGAIRFVRDGRFLDDDTTGVPAMTDLPTLLSASDDVAGDEVDDPQSLALLLRAGSSLGGARPKAHVRDENGRVAIAKFPSPADDWNVMAWEKTALDLAEAAGIDVPGNKVVKIAGRDVLVVDRFDRLDSGVRRGYQSAMTALERIDGDQGSYLDIVQIIEERSRNATTELEQLFRRVAFNILISNTDDHLRNHAFVHVHADSWALSPAFDLNPNPEPGQRHLSTAIDNDTLADLDDLLVTAGFYRLSDDDALAVVRQVRDAVCTWREVAARNGLAKAAVAAMEPAFVHSASARAAELLD